MKQKKISRLLRRVEALALAAGTLWALCVTAGSETAREAGVAMRAALPLKALQWELGDFRQRDTLSPAVAMALGEIPLLYAARPAVAEVWAAEQLQPPAEDHEEEDPIPVPEAERPVTPLVLTEVDNGVPAKTLVPTDITGYTVCGNTYISNTTDYALSPGELQTPFAARMTEEAPQILILHTHGSEAYTPVEGTGVVWSGDHRTTDVRYNVVKAGDVMADVFAEAGISVLHDRTLYDYPSYSGAYDRSLAAIESYLTQYPSIRFILDVHRDAIEDTEGNQYKVLADLENVGAAAQLSLVVGTDGGGLTHPDWMENLRLAVAVQETLLEEYPTLMRPLLLRNSRYNQHATTGSLLVEVGAAGNAPEEAALAARLFAQAFAGVLQSSREPDLPA